LRNCISIVKQMTVKDKVIYILLLIIILGLSGILFYMNIFYKPQKSQILTLNEEFKDKNLNISILYFETIFSNDLFIDYQLSDDFSEACRKYDCFLFTEVYDSSTQEYESLGPIINVKNSKYTSTGTTVIPNSLFSSFNIDITNYKVRLRIDMFKGETDELITYSDAQDIAN
jgi:hypothetical protein